MAKGRFIILGSNACGVSFHGFEGAEVQDWVFVFYVSRDAAPLFLPFFGGDAPFFVPFFFGALFFGDTSLFFVSWPFLFFLFFRVFLIFGVLFVQKFVNEGPMSMAI